MWAVWWWHSRPGQGYIPRGGGGGQEEGRRGKWLEARIGNEEKTRMFLPGFLVVDPCQLLLWSLQPLEHLGRAACTSNMWLFCTVLFCSVLCSALLCTAVHCSVYSTDLHPTWALCTAVCRCMWCSEVLKCPFPGHDCTQLGRYSVHNTQRIKGILHRG